MNPVKSFYKQNILSNLDFLQVKNFCLNYLASSEYVRYSDQHGRYYDIVDLPEDIKDIVIKSCRNELNDQTLDIVYCQIVKYQIKDGTIPKLEMHKDNLYCKYIMDLVLDSSINWPLQVESELYPGIENSAVFLNGSIDMHGRPTYPSHSDDDYVTNLFVHVSPEGDPNLEQARKFRQLPPEKQRFVLGTMIPYIG